MKFKFKYDIQNLLFLRKLVEDFSPTPHIL